MKKIPLTGKNGQGKFALVDDADFDWLMQWKWCFSNGYAIRNQHIAVVDGKQKSKRIAMHAVILGENGCLLPDHIDRDRLNNQRFNLRQATRSESQMNRGSHEGSTSRFKGVCWYNAGKKWAAYIKPPGEKPKYLGRFSREDDAALAYNFAAHQHHGEFAVFNVAGG